MIRVKEIVVNNEELDLVDYFVNRYLNAFDLELIDIKNIGAIEQHSDGQTVYQTAFLLFVNLDWVSNSINADKLIHFVLCSDYDDDVNGWTGFGNFNDDEIRSFKTMFRDVEVNNGHIVVKD